MTETVAVHETNAEEKLSARNLPKKNVNLEAFLTAVKYIFSDHLQIIPIHYHRDYFFEQKICSVFTFKGRLAAL